MSIFEVLRENIWIVLSVVVTSGLYLYDIIPVEVATDIVLFLFVSVIFGNIWDMSRA